MARSREKVQQLGIWDSEVKEPDHDAVCLWAYRNAELIFRAVHPEHFDRKWEAADVACPYPDERRQVVALATEFMSKHPRPNPRVIKKELEFVLRSYTGYRGDIERVVGYADLVIQTAVPQVVSLSQRSEKADAGEFDVQWVSEAHAPRILVEAKSTLPTVGELMRQLQLYRTAFRGKIAVVCPDESYAEILAEQGITFVRCTA